MDIVSTYVAQDIDLLWTWYRSRVMRDDIGRALAGIGATDGRSTRAGRSEYKDDHHVLSAKGPNDPAAFEPALA